MPKPEWEINTWKKLREGDSDAYEKIYRHYFEVLSRYGCGLSKDNQVVEDAIQDVFIAIWRRKEYLGEVNNLKFYLLGALRHQIIRNTSHDILEDSSDIDQFLDYLVTISTEQQIIDTEDSIRRSARCHEAISRLSLRQQEVVHLRFYQGLSLDETATLMCLSKQSVSNLLFRTYSVLRSLLKALPSFLLILSAS
jgi:RNA polymerase sigma factor (sigma-70 family)